MGARKTRKLCAYMGEKGEDSLYMSESERGEDMCVYEAESGSTC